MASFAAILAIGKPVALDASATGPGHPRVHLDHDHPAGRRVDRELDVAAAGVDADLAQHRDAEVAHPLVLPVGQRHRRRHGDRVAGVHAHRVDVLDRADHDHVVVAGRASAPARTPSSRARSPRPAPRATGQAASPAPACGAARSASCAMPEPRPPIVKDGRMTTGSRARRRPPRTSSSVWQTADCAARPPPTVRTMSLNFWRSSPRWIAAMSAPISSTPYRSSTPRSSSATAMFSAVCPPRVASTRVRALPGDHLLHELRR